jgi:hypothetical protein
MAVTTPAPDATAGTVSDVPGDVPEDVPVTVPAIALVGVPVDEVPTPAASVPETVPGKRAPRRPTAGKPSPERVFQAELERGELPSLREVMRRASVGQPRAREIRDQLAQALEEAQPEAAL